MECVKRAVVLVMAFMAMPFLEIQVNIQAMFRNCSICNELQLWYLSGPTHVTPEKLENGNSSGL